MGFTLKTDCLITSLVCSFAQFVKGKSSNVLGKYAHLGLRCTIYGSVFGKRDLLAIFHVMKYDVKCVICLHKSDCRETTLSNAANHFKIFLIDFEICLYKHLYFLYIRNPLFLIVVFISMLWQFKVNMFYKKNSFPIV